MPRNEWNARRNVGWSNQMHFTFHLTLENKICFGLDETSSSIIQILVYPTWVVKRIQFSIQRLLSANRMKCRICLTGGLGNKAVLDQLSGTPKVFLDRNYLVDFTLKVCCIKIVSSALQ